MFHYPPPQTYYPYYPQISPRYVSSPVIPLSYTPSHRSPVALPYNSSQLSPPLIFPHNSAQRPSPILPTNAPQRRYEPAPYDPAQYGPAPATPPPYRVPRPDYVKYPPIPQAGKYVYDRSGRVVFVPIIRAPPKNKKRRNGRPRRPSRPYYPGYGRAPRMFDMNHPFWVEAMWKAQRKEAYDYEEPEDIVGNPDDDAEVDDEDAQRVWSSTKYRAALFDLSDVITQDKAQKKSVLHPRQHEVIERLLQRLIDIFPDDVSWAKLKGCCDKGSWILVSKLLVILENESGPLVEEISTQRASSDPDSL
jgi:hypothetical protein